MGAIRSRPAFYRAINKLRNLSSHHRTRSQHGLRRSCSGGFVIVIASLSPPPPSHHWRAQHVSRRLRARRGTAWVCPRPRRSHPTCAAVLDIFQKLPPVRLRSSFDHVLGGPQAMSMAKVALGRRLVEHELQDTLGANDFELSGHARARGRVEEWKRPP